MRMFYKHGDVVIREAREEDVQVLKNRLREADAKEVIAAGSSDQEHALRHSFSRSDVCFSVDFKGTVVAMFGCVQDEGGTICGGAPSANVWFLGADEMSRIKKTFVKLSRYFIAQFLQKYPVLWNYSDSRYTATFRWLLACGAKMGPEFKVNGIEFIPFVFRRAQMLYPKMQNKEGK